jgi:Zn finger protein HypA/HybF involved in hydrogenase expression
MRVSAAAYPASFRCKDCGERVFDDRWAPLCVVCHDARRLEQRRERVRLTTVEQLEWVNGEELEARFSAALGPDLP